MARLLRTRCSGLLPKTIVELGAGDGTFLLSAARKLAPHWPAVHVTLVDSKDIVDARTRMGFAALGWTARTVTADVFEYLEAAHATDVVCANLFLHHFDEQRLGRLLELIQPVATVVAACEPRRSAPALGASRLLRLIGCNDVSRHDAAASVRAGFRDRELSEAWPDCPGWELAEWHATPFTHCFGARRRADARTAQNGVASGG